MYMRQGSVLIFCCFLRIPILAVSCYLLLRDRLRVTGEMEKLASDGILLGNRKRKTRFGIIPNFCGKKNRRFRILVKVFVVIILRKSKHEIPHKITTNLGPETRHILQNRILQKLPR
jgi:hypothetical protein